MGKSIALRMMALLLGTLISLLSFAQKKVTGTVNDDKGNPLVGASVTVKGQRIATTTNANGVFH